MTFWSPLNNFVYVIALLCSLNVYMLCHGEQLEEIYSHTSVKQPMEFDVNED